jgi:hypothetical protein
MINHILREDRGVVTFADGPPTPLTERQVDWVRRVLGDKPVRSIVIPIDTAATERAAIRAVFPGVQLMAYEGENFVKAFPFPGEDITKIPADGL